MKRIFIFLLLFSIVIFNFSHLSFAEDDLFWDDSDITADWGENNESSDDLFWDEWDNEKTKEENNEKQESEKNKEKKQEVNNKQQKEIKINNNNWQNVSNNTNNADVDINYEKEIEIDNLINTYSLKIKKENWKFYLIYHLEWEDIFNWLKDYTWILETCLLNNEWKCVFNNIDWVKILNAKIVKYLWNKIEEKNIDEIYYFDESTQKVKKWIFGAVELEKAAIPVKVNVYSVKWLDIKLEVLNWDKLISKLGKILSNRELKEEYIWLWIMKLQNWYVLYEIPEKTILKEYTSISKTDNKVKKTKTGIEENIILLFIILLTMHAIFIKKFQRDK